MSTSQKKKRTSIEDKFKALQEIESGQPKSLVAQKYNVPRNTISTWLLPANKEKIMAAFSSGTISLKRKNVKAGKHENLDKAVFKWFMSARSNNIPVKLLSHVRKILRKLLRLKQCSFILFLRKKNPFMWHAFRKFS